MTSVNSSPKKARSAWLLVALPAWVYGTLLAVQLALGVAVGLLASVLLLGEQSLLAAHPVLFGALFALATYGVTIALVIWLPRRLRGQVTTRQELGISDRPTWLDVLLTPVGTVLYFGATVLTVSIVHALLPIDIQQPQQLPFSQEMLTGTWQYILAFLTMVVLAPLGEEVLFRGYLYGKLRARFRLLPTIIATSLTFGLAHLWVGGSLANLQWLVAIDTAMLSVFLCLAREKTGAIWTSVGMHMLKNGLAFCLLFVYPIMIQ